MTDELQCEAKIIGQHTPPEVMNAINTITAYLRAGGWCEVIISDTGGAAFNLTSIYSLIPGTKELMAETIARCGRCGRPIEPPDAAEVCWWCQGDLCVQCWEQHGHCGHPEAEAVNERMRAWYEEHGKSGVGGEKDNEHIDCS